MDPSLYITPEEYEIAEKNGIPRRNLNVRVRELFWEKERAITEPLQKNKPTSWTEWKETALKNGISRFTFAGRIQNGWEPEKAATDPIRDRTEILANARENKRVLTEVHLRIMRENNLKSSTVHSRLFRGWTMEEAITKPASSRNKPVQRAVTNIKMKKSV